MIGPIQCSVQSLRRKRAARLPPSLSAGVWMSFAALAFVAPAPPAAAATATEPPKSASAIPGEAPSKDRLETLLAEADYEATRADLLRELQRPGGLPCWRLGAFGEDRNERVREHAVRALSDAGCAHFDSYRPYIGDPSAWVTDAIMKAAERHLISGAVPFLISHLTDTRTILSDEGGWTIGEGAHRALRVVTCQSFHFDPHGTPQGQADAIAQWSRWYEAHLFEPRGTWVAAGIGLAGDYIGRDHAPHRKEGFELLALIGAPALPALRTAFQRGPQDLRVALACTPDEPPRVTDQVPCVLTVANLSTHRVALAPAPGDPQVRLVPHEATPAEPPEGRPQAGRPAGSPPSRSSKPRTGESRSGAAPPTDKRPADKSAAGTGSTETRPADLRPAEIAGRIVDLAPGEVLQREFRVGPVAAAGHYEVRATLIDLASSIGSSPLPPIEATTPLRFEQ